MKRALLLIIFLLAACGPREVGQGTSEEAGYVGAGAQSTAEFMRYPVAGASRTQRYLYYSNQPDVMERVRQWRLSEFRTRMGFEPSPEDPAYREVPKERSPFRQ